MNVYSSFSIDSAITIHNQYRSYHYSGDGTSYIPNDLTLGGRTADLTYHPKMLLLSGPNMGGSIIVSSSL